MTKRITLIIGIVLAVFAVLLTKVFLDKQRQDIETQATRYIEQQQQNQAAVLVATQDIPQGVLVDPNMFEAAVVSAKKLAPRSVSSFDKIVGMGTVAPIAKGEQVSLNKLMPVQQSDEASRGSSLAMATPVGKRAVTIPVDNISSVGGMIRPGDYVDVLCVVPATDLASQDKQAKQEAIISLFQNILVLAVGQDLAVPTPGLARIDRKQKKEEKEAVVAPIITLALNPEEANLLAFVQKQSEIRLVLRSPIDSQVQTSPPANWQTLLEYLRIVPPQKKEVIEEGPPPDMVEIIRGQDKQVVPLNK